jgi:hypothetical protein
MSIARFHEYLTETSLSRVWMHFTEPSEESAVMSASKHEFSAQVNASRTLELASKIRAAGFGYIYVDGRYNGTEETSIAIFGGKNGKLKGYLRQWQKDYDQESILYKPDGTDHAFLLFNEREVVDVGVFHPNRAGEFMTALRGRPGTFVFEQAYGSMGFFGRLLARATRVGAK